MSDDIISDEEKAALAVGPDDEDQSGEVNDQQQSDDQQTADEEQRARDEKGRFVAKEGEEEVQQEEKPKGDGKVPQGALHAERERRKAAEARAEEAQKSLNQIAEMRAKLNGGSEQQQQQGDDDPDSVEYLKRKIAELEQGQTKTTRYLEGQQLDNAEHAQLVTLLTQSENAFRQDHPDYDAAIEHVIGARANELRIYGLTDVEINQTIREEIADISRAAIAQKRDPAEVGYEIAKLRGYIAKAPEQQQQAKPNGKAADVIAAIANAQKSGKSLGQASGATAQAINAETIAAMTQAEFDQLYSTPEGRALIDSL
jgi:hypothetical protein